MYTVSVSIDIAAAPATVREKFLDFCQLPVYHRDGFFKSIGPETPNTPLEPGVKMRNVLELMTVHATLVENSSTCFQWGGGLPGIFVGYHSFCFEPSTLVQGGTKFTQKEEFKGFLAFIMGDNFVARWIGTMEKTRKGWNKYNEDLKAWCEGLNNRKTSTPKIVPIHSNSYGYPAVGKFFSTLVVKYVHLVPSLDS
ncbi:hypothetical protein UA08_04455 [Talaromyces atroroseus]|uniref:Uncharacterized protein n=1 Tax=Talaromyces atroroseus TaxID=1441469 RepID=A0A1Q5Q866_TALAT|nr:hypothetical protein UA08_04455 [Talaromyces atroroseus]OKL60323.1 hypothetical protein UA08_04455 [Talaromyces atroroseus]